MNENYLTQTSPRFASEESGYNFFVGGKSRAAIQKSVQAPIKQAIKTANKFSTKHKRPSFDLRYLSEMIRHPIKGIINNDYSIVNDDGKVIGNSKIRDNNIEELSYLSEYESFHGQILDALLFQMLREADARHANLTIELNPDETPIKMFLDRFGFEQTGDFMTRIAGTSNPVRPMITRGL